MTSETAFPPCSPSPSSRHRISVLGWPAWLRILAVLPVVALLWLAVAWAGLEAAPL